jgi:citrate synthase
MARKNLSLWLDGATEPLVLGPTVAVPSEMFTVIFAIGRIPGWIANYREVSETEAGRICRPRQIYVGKPLATYVPVDHRANA